MRSDFSEIIGAGMSAANERSDRLGREGLGLYNMVHGVKEIQHAQERKRLLEQQKLREEQEEADYEKRLLKALSGDSSPDGQDLEDLEAERDSSAASEAGRAHGDNYRRGSEIIGFPVEDLEDLEDLNKEQEFLRIKKTYSGMDPWR
jgi:hypothetical protein